MNVIHFESIKNKADNEIIERLREFQDYYEYCIISKYEEKYTCFETNSIQINKVHAVTLETKDKFLLVGILFYKDLFDFEEVVNWLKVYNIKYVDNESFVKNANELIQGIHFKGNTIVLYKKGNKNLSFKHEDFQEITKIYDIKMDRVNTTKSKSARKELPERLVIYLNDEEVDEIPRLEFDINKDYIICNGNLIKADYIDSFNHSTIGFFRKQDPINPIAYLIDIYTEVFIELSEREDGASFCFIDYNYIIDPYEI